MASRISPARLLVLGVVQRRGQAHGYQVSRDLLGWRADYWARVGAGSVYQALRTLTKYQYLAEVGTVTGGGGPERTVYAITSKGETELLHLIRLALSDPETGPEALNAAFAMLDRIDVREIVSLLGYRVRALRRRLPSQADADDPLMSEMTPKRISVLRDLYDAQTHAEIEWSVSLMREIENNRFNPAE